MEDKAEKMEELVKDFITMFYINVDENGEPLATEEEQVELLMLADKLING